MQPAAGAEQARVDQDHPDAEHQRGDHRRQHDAAIKLAFHDLEALPAGLVLAHRVIDEQAWQIEQAGEPADDGNDVQRFEPEVEHRLNPWSANASIVVAVEAQVILAVGPRSKRLYHRRLYGFS